MLSTNKPLSSLCAADIMTKNVVMIAREMSLEGAAHLLAGAHVTGAPVLDDDGKCIGVVSATDFMHWVEKEKDHHHAGHPVPAAAPLFRAWQLPEGTEPTWSVERVMTKNPILAPAHTRLAELARLMTEMHVHRIIIVNGSQRPIGIVSSMDMLAVLARVDETHADNTHG